MNKEDKKLLYLYSSGGPLRELLVALLRRQQKTLCADYRCDLLLSGYQIDHKRYEPDITLKDLQLLCGKCHAKKTGVKSHNGRLARFKNIDPFP